jgi:hypothetical protein
MIDQQKKKTRGRGRGRGRPKAVPLSTRTTKIEMSAHFNKAYRAHLKDMQIPRSITGLTGEECDKVLRRYYEWSRPLSSHRLYNQFRDAVHQLYVLFNHKHTQEQWRDRARAWAIHVSTYFGVAINSCIYLHVLAVHAYRWYPINKWTSQGLEKVNGRLKELKRRSWRDRLPDPSVKRCPADGTLTWITNTFNAMAAIDIPTIVTRKSSKTVIVAEIDAKTPAVITII